MSWNAKTRWSTPTGRAKSPGRVTRASLSVRRSHDGKPLPVHLQVHPKKLSPTSHNPGCLTFSPANGTMVATMKKMRGNSVGYGDGEGLDGGQGARLYVQGRDGYEYGTFSHSSLTGALGWARAARAVGFKVDVYQYEDITDEEV